jgi:hypothetical protein
VGVSSCIPFGWQFASEIHDLAKEPKELNNLFDKMGDQGASEMQKLVEFFQTHQIRKEGYEIPYRR